MRRDGGHFAEQHAECLLWRAGEPPGLCHLIETRQLFDRLASLLVFGPESASEHAQSRQDIDLYSCNSAWVAEMKPLARVRIVMWEGASLWIVDAAQARQGETGRADFHSHHAIQISLALGGWFRLDTQDTHVSGDAAAVAADTKHVIDAEGLTGIVFIEPESEAGRAITRRLFGDRELVAVKSHIIDDLRERMAAAYKTTVKDDRALVLLGRELVSTLSAGAVANDADPRIRKVIAWAAEQIDQPIGLSDALAVGGLSASRLRHLFVEQTGLPFKTYLLWLRLTRAVEVVAGGASLTQAAHEAGFSDSAHFSRTFRRMFGVPPAALRIV